MDMNIKVSLPVVIIFAYISNIECCQENEFECIAEGWIPKCISIDRLCDGLRDCWDGADETSNLCQYKGCQPSDLIESIGDIISLTPVQSFRCQYGGCIPLLFKCNGIPNCLDGSDETLEACEGNRCESDEFQCDYGGCISRNGKCNGRVDCPDGSDETSYICSKRRKRCRRYHFQCNYGACIPRRKICDGKAHCADASDESEETCGPQHNFDSTTTSTLIQTAPNIITLPPTTQTTSRQSSSTTTTTTTTPATTTSTTTTTPSSTTTTTTTTTTTPPPPPHTTTTTTSTTTTESSSTTTSTTEMTTSSTITSSQPSSSSKIDLSTFSNTSTTIRNPSTPQTNQFINLTFPETPSSFPHTIPPKGVPSTTRRPFVDTTTAEYSTTTQPIEGKCLESECPCPPPMMACVPCSNQTNIRQQCDILLEEKRLCSMQISPSVEIDILSCDPPKSHINIEDQFARSNPYTCRFVDGVRPSTEAYVDCWGKHFDLYRCHDDGNWYTTDDINLKNPTEILCQNDRLNPEVCGQNPKANTFSRKNVHWPLLVTLRQNEDSFCSGSLISSRFVLTAASCIFIEFFGELLQKDLNLIQIKHSTWKNPSQYLEVSSVFTDPTLTTHKDLLKSLILLRLKMAVQFSESLVPACIVPGYDKNNSHAISIQNSSGNRASGTIQVSAPEICCNEGFQPQKGEFCTRAINKRDENVEISIGTPYLVNTGKEHNEKWTLIGVLTSSLNKAVNPDLESGSRSGSFGLDSVNRAGTSDLDAGSRSGSLQFRPESRSGTSNFLPVKGSRKSRLKARSLSTSGLLGNANNGGISDCENPFVFTSVSGSWEWIKNCVNFGKCQ